MSLENFRLYNTLSNQVEDFQPLKPGTVGMYVCGPTVYDDAHLGHARCYITWDVLYRVLQFAGYDVTYVRNVTDVDDKILNRAKERDITPKALSEQYYQSFLADMDALNVKRPNHEPKAMDYIQEMLTGIQALIQNGAAYVTPEGTVYYDTTAKKDYGKLSKKPLDDLLAGARVDVDPHKKSPTDFALWKHVGEAETTFWETPWDGRKGRPGWHMECSAMSRSILGDQLDIHCGGSDLIFPHHENEIAQSESWTGKAPFVKYWMHNGFVNVSGEKMSKSLGNFATVKTMLGRYDANTIRYFLLTHHYRMPVDFNDEALQSAENRVIKLHRALKGYVDAQGLLEGHVQALCADTRSLLEDGDVAPFWQALQEDMNTPQALAVLNELVGQLNTQPTEALFRLVVSLWSLLGFSLAPLFETANLPESALAALGAQYLGAGYQAGTASVVVLESLLTARITAKAEKNWAVSDGIRDDLKKLGVALMDSKDGTTSWEYTPVQPDTQPVG